MHEENVAAGTDLIAAIFRIKFLMYKNVHNRGNFRYKCAHILADLIEYDAYSTCRHISRNIGVTPWLK